MNNWTNQYACHSLQIGKFRATINWSPYRDRHFEVAFAGVRLKNDFKSLEEGKAAALRLARRVLTEAMSSLDSAVATESEGVAQ